MILYHVRVDNTVMFFSVDPPTRNNLGPRCISMAEDPPTRNILGLHPISMAEDPCDPCDRYIDRDRCDVRLLAESINIVSL
jgi:hypothetical protein